MEEKIWKHSPFISLSTKEDSAFHFVDSTGSIRLKACELWEATHFVWKIEGVRAEQLFPGHFRLFYRASPQNVDRFAQRQTDQAKSNPEAGLARALLTNIVHEHLRLDSSTHTADIINVATFLEASTDLADARLRNNTIDKAKQFAEWLVYPRDPMSDGHGYDTHFWPNQFLDVHLFAKEA